MSTKILTVNYPALEKTLAEQDIQNPDRTKSYLDIVKENFAKNTFEILQWDTAILEVHHDNLHITKLGDELQGEYYGIPDSSFPQTQDEVFYENFIQAMEQAKEMGVYDEIFKEVVAKKE
jgi:hypothetical protein